MRQKLVPSRTATATHVEWRERCLREAGFGADLAARIASDARYDLHALLGLVDDGCPTGLAARIIAPLDAEEPA